jgi:hypothetical protein
MIVHPLGSTPAPHPYAHERRSFAGDCVLATLRHFVHGLANGAAFETDGREYLKTLAVQEAIYASAASGQFTAVRPLSSR